MCGDELWSESHQPELRVNVKLVLSRNLEILAIKILNYIKHKVIQTC